VPPLRDGHPIGAAGPRPAAHDVLVPELPGRRAVSDIEVRCAATDAGWRCDVDVRDASGTSGHVVTVDPAHAADLAAATDVADVERLVYETFDFLLERESKESILRSFDLTVVSRYFPDYEHEIRSRLAP
jgi:hypothetical protein